MNNLAEKFENQSIRDMAYETLKQEIITGALPAGTRIKETEYSNKLHISRTPLREALHRLEKEGLVEYLERRGVLVRTFTIEDVEEIYNIRNSLEMLTVPYIIKNVDKQDTDYLRQLLKQMDPLVEEGNIEELSPLAREFHNYITGISKQKRVLSIINSQDGYIKRYSPISIARESRREESHNEHYQLLDALIKRDEVAFRTIMYNHIERSKEMCLLALKESHRLVSRSE